MGKHDVIRKTGSIYTDNSLERREMRTDSATAKGNRPMHRKFGDVRMCGFRDMHAEWPVVRQTDTQTGTKYPQPHHAATLQGAGYCGILDLVQQ